MSEEVDQFDAGGESNLPFHPPTQPRSQQRHHQHHHHRHHRHPRHPRHQYHEYELVRQVHPRPRPKIRRSETPANANNIIVTTTSVSIIQAGQVLGEIKTATKATRNQQCFPMLLNF